VRAPRSERPSHFPEGACGETCIDNASMYNLLGSKDSKKRAWVDRREVHYNPKKSDTFYTIVGGVNIPVHTALFAHLCQGKIVKYLP